jgi:hypothetical protein
MHTNIMARLKVDDGLPRRLGSRLEWSIVIKLLSLGCRW